MGSDPVSSLTRLPTLPEVLEWLPDGVGLVIEIKARAAADAVVEALRGHPVREGRLAVISFDEAAIAPHLAFLDDLRAAGQLEMTGGFSDRSGGAAPFEVRAPAEIGPPAEEGKAVRACGMTYLHVPFSLGHPVRATAAVDEFRRQMSTPPSSRDNSARPLVIENAARLSPTISEVRRFTNVKR